MSNQSNAPNQHTLLLQADKQAGRQACGFSTVTNRPVYQPPTLLSLGM
ncbi:MULTISPECIES: hypothetical protein [unclassified Anaerobiospirillum]|nr:MULTISPECIES: hypothetical protein [unclassified Anaerobiospirillum]MCK0534573.1 hypothetical protein [Anaerobiospirillum sp. NML120511]MCK0540611.1 hypothetical protein [Anaerobiospirillum sp. NML02-A-032]